MCTKLSERVGKYILVLVYPVSLCTVLSDTIIYSWGAEDGGGFSPGNKFGGYFTVVQSDGSGHLMPERTLVSVLLLCPPFNVFFRRRPAAKATFLVFLRRPRISWLPPSPFRRRRAFLLSITAMSGPLRCLSPKARDCHDIYIGRLIKLFQV